MFNLLFKNSIMTWCEALGLLKNSVGQKAMEGRSIEVSLFEYRLLRVLNWRYSMMPLIVNWEHNATEITINTAQSDLMHVNSVRAMLGKPWAVELRLVLRNLSTKLAFRLLFLCSLEILIFILLLKLLIFGWIQKCFKSIFLYLPI